MSSEPRRSTISIRDIFKGFGEVPPEPAPTVPPLPARDDEVIAILSSDWHLWHEPPVARSAEENWLEAMARPLLQMEALREQYQCPIICAGDLFHLWHAPAELINWCFRYLPKDIYAIPGQHDLPNHSLSDIRRTGYWTLVEAERIKHITYQEPIKLRGLILYGFPWGCPLHPCLTGDVTPYAINLAVIHHYIWQEGFAHRRVENKDHISRLEEMLEGYHAAVFGDNHMGFHAVGNSGLNVLNCGTLIRRRSDERSYKPQVGLLHADGSITPKELDCSKDRFLEKEEDGSSDNPTFIETDLTNFLSGLADLGDQSLDFTETLRRRLNESDVNEQVRTLLLGMLEK